MPWILLLIAVIALGLFILRQDANKIYTCLEKLASQYNGTVRRPLISHPQLTFKHDNTEFLVSAMPSSHSSATNSATSPSTFIHFYLNTDTDDKLSVRSKSIQTKIDKLTGIKQYTAQNPAFDEKFVIITNQQDLIHQLLTPQVQECLLKLRGIASCAIQYQKIKFFNGTEWVEKPRCSVDIDKISTDIGEYELLIQIAKLLKAKF